MGAFISVVVLFVTVVESVWHNAGDISVAAASITDNASPSIEHLAAARVAMEDLVARVNEALARASPEEVDQVAISADRRELSARLGAYEALAPYENERTGLPALRRDIERFTRAVDSTLSVAGDLAAAKGIAAGELRAAHDRAAASMLTLIEMNAENARRLAGQIEASRETARRELTILEVIAATASALIALVALQEKRRYEALLRVHQRETELRADERGQFAARVAHDIRSPLTTVGLSLQMIANEQTSREAAAVAIKRASRAVDRVDRIVDGLLEFARAGAHPAPGAHTAARPVIEDLVEELRTTADEGGVEIVVEPSPPVEVACSSGVLTSILANLLRNALKYMCGSNERRVTVRIIERGGLARFEVEDTGPGLPEELREKIFEPYVRAPGASQPGIGLGLATVKRLCEGYGGRVGQEPVPRGGSRFWFVLPRWEEPGPRTVPSH